MKEIMRLFICLFLLFWVKLFPLHAAGPEPILLTPERLARIAVGLEDEYSQYAQAFALLRARVDSEDLALFDATATNLNYARSYYAQAAAFVYRVTGEARYATLAYEALYAVHNEPDTDNFLPESGGNAGNAGLVRATVGLGFGLAYNWAYTGWTEEQRTYVRERVHAGLAMWPGYSHANLGGTRGSNWVAVCRGGELMMILGIGEQAERSGRVNTLVNELRQHLQNGHDAIGGTQEGIGYVGYGGIFLLPAIYAAADAGNTVLSDYIASTPRQWHQKALYSGSFAMVPEGSLLEQRKVWQPSGVGGPNTNDEGWASLILGSVPQEDLPYFLWWYDRHMGTAAFPANRPELHFETRRQGTMWALLFYPDDVTAVDPTGRLPVLITGDQGRHFMRARWQDPDDVMVAIHADLRHHSNAWAQSEAGQLGLTAYGVSFFNGPRTGRDPADYSRVLVNGQRGADADAGRRVLAESFADGAYVVVDGHNQYRNMGLAGYQRHLMVQFGAVEANNAVLAVFDRMESHEENTYTWNLNLGNPVADFGIVVASGEDQGFATFTLLAPSGGLVKGWVIEPLAAQLQYVDGSRLWFDHTMASGDFVVVMSVEPEVSAALEVLDSGLAGTLLRIGDKWIAYDRGRGQLLQGEAAVAVAFDHERPLTVRGLEARVLASDKVSLRWYPVATGAEQYRIERMGPGESAFVPVAELAGDQNAYLATGLLPDSAYQWRVVSVANGRESEPTPPVAATTWETGMAVYVEDFAPRINGNLPTENAIGHWQTVNQDRGWILRANEGSPRNAVNLIGEMATEGRTRINFQNIFFTEGIIADLSTPSAAVEVDIRTEGTIRFSLMLKLADGRWVRRNSEAHIASRESWHLQRWDIPADNGWRLFNMETLATGDPISLSADDLAEVHGIGIRAQWPLNERWARVDQLHLYAKNLVRTDLPPAAPTGLAASQGSPSDSVQLSWSAVAGASAYAIRRAQQPDFALAIPVASDWQGLAFEDFAPVGWIYYYWVAGQTEAGTTGEWAGPVRGRAGRSVVQWGGGDLELAMPESYADAVQVALGGRHGLAILPDGEVVAWGNDTAGQATVPAFLAAVDGEATRRVVAVAAGERHSLALLANGHVVGWGDDTFGQVMGADSVPPITAIAAGDFFSLALDARGRIHAWGDDSGKQLQIPRHLPPAVAIAAGGAHALALLSNGSVVAWGDNSHGQVNLPQDLQNVRAIAAGARHSLALLRDGTVRGWGDNESGQAPDFWNYPDHVGSVDPQADQEFNMVVGIAAGEAHSVLILANGEGVTLGDSSDNYVADSIAPNAHNAAVVASGDGSLALRRQGPPVAVAVAATGLTITPGATAILQAYSLGAGYLQYYWEHNGVAIAESNEPFLILADFGSEQTGAYTATAINEHGSVSSAPISIELGEGTMMAEYFSGFDDLGDGWAQTSWFGSFYHPWFPWIYSQDWGWIWCAGWGGEHLLFYLPSIDGDQADSARWIETEPGFYPHYFDFNDGEWVLTEM